MQEAGKKPPDFSDCDKAFEISASDKERGAKPEFVEDKEYVGCKYTVTTTADDARGVGLGLTLDADKVSLSIGKKFFNGVELDKSMVGDFKVSVTFPGKVISHSDSSSVDGNTVTWTDIKDSTSRLKAVSERPSAGTEGPSYWNNVGGRAIQGALIGLIVGIW
ncbi:LppM family (lipo)protein [Cutibacterium porci]|uniref:LppM family (lipo)protein n=1 Tax=Cutibacterium porci TaxID=2605781 RepID=UPI0038990C35